MKPIIRKKLPRSLACSLAVRISMKWQLTSTIRLFNTFSFTIYYITEIKFYRSYRCNCLGKFQWKCASETSRQEIILTAFEFQNAVFKTIHVYYNIRVFEINKDISNSHRSKVKKRLPWHSIQYLCTQNFNQAKSLYRQFVLTSKVIRK